MLFNFEKSTRFHVYGTGVDMRKCIHSLYSFIKLSFDQASALNGDVFVFIGTSRKSIKMLRWQKEGFVLYHKKLELGLYSLPTGLVEGTFSELHSDVLNRVVSHIKHQSRSGELRRFASLNI